LKTLAFISHKGGVGKSTLAIHLAVEAHQQGLETLLVDLDSISSTASEWASIRKDNQPVVVTAELSDIQDLYQQAVKEEFDLLIFDCPPYLTDEVLGVSEIVDYTLLPVTPGFPELQSLPRFIELVEQPYSVVLNSCTQNKSPEEPSETTQLAQMLGEHNIPVSVGHITRSEALSDALSTGAAVCEYSPDSEATEQIRALLALTLKMKVDR